jgi:hypothetical protein
LQIAAFAVAFLAIHGDFLFVQTTTGVFAAVVETAVAPAIPAINVFRVRVVS